MNKIAFWLYLLFTLQALGQDQSTAPLAIVAEGKALYRSEMASWYGTDLFLANYKDPSKIGGYFSYTEDNFSSCIFFSKSADPNVIGSVTFDNTYNLATAVIDQVDRAFTPLEQDLYTIRKRSLEEINTDTLFKSYSNSRLNLIPLIKGDDKKVYVLTGPTQSGVVIFGNDYLLSFDKYNKIVSKEQLHKNIIPIEYGETADDEQVVVSTMHSHSEETGDFITATDICTLMLYSKFANWKMHHVISKQNLNIWDCETNELVVISTDAVNHIIEHQNKP